MPPDHQAEIDRCVAEQRRCADQINAPGAWQGVNDWLAEEVLLRLEDLARDL